MYRERAIQRTPFSPVFTGKETDHPWRCVSVVKDVHRASARLTISFTVVYSVDKIRYKFTKSWKDCGEMTRRSLAVVSPDEGRLHEFRGKRRGKIGLGPVNLLVNSPQQLLQLYANLCFRII